MLAPFPYDKSRSRSWNATTPWRWRGLSWGDSRSYGYLVWHRRLHLQLRGRVVQPTVSGGHGGSPWYSTPA